MKIYKHKAWILYVEKMILRFLYRFHLLPSVDKLPNVLQSAPRLLDGIFLTSQKGFYIRKKPVFI